LNLLADPEVEVVVPEGTTPEAGCLVELVRAIRNHGDVDMSVARLVTDAGIVIEAGVHLWRDLDLRGYGAGGNRDDPRWAPGRDVDGAVLAPYAVRRRLELPVTQDPMELALQVQALGRRVVCPAAAWARRTGADAPPLGRLAAATAERFPEVVASREPAGTAAGWLGPRPAGARVLVCDRWLPRPDHYAGEKRAADLLAALRALGCAVTLVSMSGLRRQPYTEDYEAMGVEVFAPGLERVGPGEMLDRLARDRSNLYDLVIVPWPELFAACHDAVRRCFPRATLAYDVHDLHHLRLAQQGALTGDVSDEEVERYRRLELDAARRCDVAFVVNADEGRALSEMAPGCRVELVPVVHEVAEDRGLAGRSGLLFVGGFGHPPNADAVLWFADEVLPLIQVEVPAVLTVVGPDAPARVTALHGDAIDVTGHLVDLERAYDSARVFVAPLRFGAGVKGKNVHALARGLPLVTTTTGAAGIRLTSGVDAFVENEPATFAHAVVRLLTDDVLWSVMASAGREVARRDHSMAALTMALGKVLGEAQRSR
jgi:glycosyltransferase involved in cell wall biosynthesis